MSGRSRPRRVRSSYTEISKSTDTDKQKVSFLHDQEDDSPDSGESDFDPTTAMDEDDNVTEESESNMDAMSIEKPSKTVSKLKSTTKNIALRDSRIAEAKIKSQSLPNSSRAQRPGPSATSALLSKDHRYRPETLWYPPTSNERLESKPDPFAAASLVPTTTTDDPKTARRVQKAWMYCISPGPCWELIENRGFYKEEYMHYETGSKSGREVRPLVYSERVQMGSFTPLTAHPTPESIKCYCGPLDAQTLYELRPFTAEAIRDPPGGDSYLLFNAGDPITSLDWCPMTAEKLREDCAFKQYLAISTLRGHPKGPTGSCSSLAEHGPVQLWSISKGLAGASRVMECEACIYLEGGCAIQIRWCPLPSHLDVENANLCAMGWMAAVALDGSIALYDVPGRGHRLWGHSMPSEDMALLDLRPIFKLGLPDTRFQVLDWANSEVIAVGCSNGYVAVYQVKEALLGRGNAVLMHYFPVHQNAIQSLCWIRAPSTSAKGDYFLKGDPTFICSNGSEGTVKVTDVRDCVPRLLVRNREVPHSNAYSSFCGTLISTDVDFWVKMFQLQPATFGKGHLMVDVGGAAMSISASDMHPIIAVGSADGSCTTSNLLRGTRREGSVPLLNHKIFQLDYSPETGNYKILDHFLPQESGTSEGPGYKDSTAPSRPNTQEDLKERFEKGQPEPSGLWHPNVAVTAVSWNNGCGPGRAHMLASCTASGLARIDILEGKWMRSVVPYGSIEAIRRERTGSGEMASDSESE